MEQTSNLSAEAKAARLNELAETISNMRTRENSDVCLISQDREFFAHKWVLESASPYFTIMFSSELKEAKSGRVTFDEMEAEILESILDFIYLGNVDKIKTEDQLKKVLAVSHLMQLQTLFRYCCCSLESSLSVGNFFEYFHISEKYEAVILRNKVESFWLDNSRVLLDTKQFLCLSVFEMKTLVNYLKHKGLCLDGIVEGIVEWLCHDLTGREMFATDLLQCVDGKSLSIKCIRSLLQNEDLMTTSSVICEELKNLSVITVISGNNVAPLESVTVDKPTVEIAISDPWATTVSYVSPGSFEKKCDSPSSSQEDPTSSYHFTYKVCVQRFDLGARTWLPPIFPNPKGFPSTFHLMCQYKHLIYSFTEKQYGRYNLLNNHFEYFFQPRFTLPTNCTIFYFNEYFYAVGGTTPTCSVICLKPGDDTLSRASCLGIKQGERPLVLTSLHYIYVVGDNPDVSGELAVQYNANPVEGCPWVVIRISNQGLYRKQFFVLNDTLNALQFIDCYCQQLIFDHSNKKFWWKRYVYWPDSELTSLELSKFQNPLYPFVFFSKKSDYLQIPCFKWEPEAKVWTELPLPKGMCFIPKSSGMESFYFAEK